MQITAPRTKTAQNRPDAVGLLRQYIATEELKPGDRLPSIRTLAKRFGLKTGVVRDALLDAQGRGIVKVLPRAGAFVGGSTAPSLASQSVDRIGSQLGRKLAAQDQNLFHLLDARETLELDLIGRAAHKRELQDLFPLRQILEDMAAIPPEQRDEEYVQLDIDFHLEVARLSGNAVMTAMLQTLLEELKPHLRRLSWSTERHSRTDESHATLYSALVSGEVDTARSELRAHLQDAYNSLLDQLRQPPTFPT